MRLRTTSLFALCGFLFLVACGGSNKSEGSAADADGSTGTDGSSASSGAVGSGGSSSVSNAAVTGTSTSGFTAATDSASAASATSGSGGTGIDVDGDGVVDGAGATDGSGVAGAAGAGSEPPDLEPGTLTAGIWDDNQNFDWFSGYYDDQNGSQLSGWFSSDDHEAAHETYLQATGSYDTLDVSLVIDTTGSMGDELDYLQVEFDAIASAIEERYQNAEQRWSLIVYRDELDEYVTKPFDFTSDLAVFRQNLAAQTHGGGGDFPEAPDRALQEMNQLEWRDDAKTLKLAFWVADAPHHDDEQSVDRFTQAVLDAGTQGIRINPVASSGVDEFTELTMRSTAQLTGGQYLFLTDDSGVGGEHKEPTIPCYYVTTLADALLRVVDAAMNGEPAPVDQNRVVRTVGKPNARSICDVAGQDASAF